MFSYSKQLSTLESSKKRKKGKQQCEHKVQSDLCIFAETFWLRVILGKISNKARL